MTESDTRSPLKRPRQSSEPNQTAATATSVGPNSTVIPNTKKTRIISNASIGNCEASSALLDTSSAYTPSSVVDTKSVRDERGSGVSINVPDVDEWEHKSWRGILQTRWTCDLEGCENHGESCFRLPTPRSTVHLPLNEEALEMWQRDIKDKKTNLNRPTPAVLNILQEHRDKTRPTPATRPRPGPRAALAKFFDWCSRQWEYQEKLDVEAIGHVRTHLVDGGYDLRTLSDLTSYDWRQMGLLEGMRPRVQHSLKEYLLSCAPE